MNTTADREIRISRLLNAPVTLVFQAWTQPQHVAQWWGPTGFRNTIHEMTVAPGGVWRFLMHGPDGRDYPNRVVFKEVIANERLVYLHTDDIDGIHAPGEAAIQFEVTVTFTEQQGKTHIEMRLLFANQALRDRVAHEFGAIDGANQTLDRLAAYLETMAR